MSNKNPFSRENPLLQTAWDSTSLGLLKTCPRKYQYKMLENWSKKGENVHLAFGIHYHSGLEAYDHSRANGATHEEAVEFAVNKTLIAAKDFIGTSDPETLPDKGDIKSKATLIRAIVWYLEHFRNDPAETVILDNGKPAVELSFKMELPIENSFGENIILCGHIDRLVKLGGLIYVLDRKTTGSTISSKYYEQYNPNNQISLYAFASQVVLPEPAVGVIIDACQLAVNFARFHRGIITQTAKQLDDWLNDFSMYMQLAETYAENNHFPMNDTACSNYGGCEFRKVCAAECSIRPLLLNNDFEKRVWNPLIER